MSDVKKKTTKKDSTKEPLKDATKETTTKKKTKSSTITESPTDKNVDFEAGMMFNKFDTTGQGMISADEFRKLWREAKNVDVKKGIESIDDTKKLLDDKTILKSDPLMVFYESQVDSNQSSLPLEVITGRLLTHYDETAGVAIPSSAVEHHRSLGNSVSPLVESYRVRYERLRLMLTGKLLPRREHILQLRRQLESCSTGMFMRL